MAITRDDFNKIWASTSPLTPYSFSESQYKEGWNFIGSTPPSRQMWDFLQKTNDEKMQYLLTHFDNYLPLSGGTLTGNLAFSGTAGVASVPITISDTGTEYRDIQIVHTDGNRVGVLRFSRNENSNSVLIGASDAKNSAPVGLTVIRTLGDGSTAGTVTVEAPTPVSSDNSTKVATTAFVNTKANILVPTGVVQAFAGSTTPQGWLLCDGSAVSRTNYAALYAVIGTTYGAGNGSTTFNLPNLIDKFVEGSATAGTVKSAGLPNITGSMFSFLTGGANQNQGALYQTTEPSETTTGNSSGSAYNWRRVNLDAFRSNSIYGNSSTVQPPALTMRYIIKY